jgi:hypothetical protein
MHPTTSAHLLLLAALLAAFPVVARAQAPTVRASQSGQTFTLENGILSVRFDAADGSFDALSGQAKLVTRGRVGLLDGQASLVDVDSSLGKGRAIQIARDSLTDRIILYPQLPFVILQQSIRNKYADPTTTHTITQLHLPVSLPSKDARVLGCDGLTPADQNRASYAFLAAADPGTRRGVVAGWLTSHRGSGIVFSKPVPGENQLYVEGRVDYGKLLLQPGESAEGEVFAIGHFDDALLGLEAYADTVARLHSVKLKPIPSGYCTWYSRPHGGAADEKSLKELATFAKEKLAGFGFNLVQIDDKWQLSSRDYTTHKPTGPYPSGMKATADTLQSLGMTPGLWFIPFGWDPKSPTFAGKQDYFVKRPDGTPYEVKWAGSCLDMTHPGARDLLRDTVSRVTHEWGYKYLKLDGLWTGMAAQILYPNPAVRDDKLGDATFHDPRKTNVEAYRDGLKLVRQAAGDDVYITGCNVAQNMRTLAASFGLVDALRVGRDIGASWEKILPSMTMGTRLYFFHGRTWHNDPDCLMLREPLTLEQARAWASWIAVSGQLNLVSEWLPGLPEDRLEIIKRSMPNTGLCGRPLDLFERNDPRVWKLSAGTGKDRRDIVALFNWSDKESIDLEIPLTKLDLPPAKAYVGVEFWRNERQEFLAPIAGALTATLPPGSCRVFSLRPVADHPQVLGTFRHITMGITDLADERYDPATRTLSATSKVVGGDPYKMFILIPAAEGRITKAQVSPEDQQAGVTTQVDEAGPLARVTLRAPTPRAVHWKITF